MRKISKNKKALSTIIATMLLVLLTITAILIVWAFVKKMVESKIESTSCYDYREYVRILDSAYTCYGHDEVTGKDYTSLNIERSFEDKSIDGIYVALSEAGGGKSYKIDKILDVDGNGVVNGDDVQKLNALVIAGTTDLRYDYDLDGEVTSSATGDTALLWGYTTDTKKSEELYVPMTLGESKTYKFTEIKADHATITVIAGGKNCDQVSQTISLQAC